MLFPTSPRLVETAPAPLLCALLPARPGIVPGKPDRKHGAGGAAAAVSVGEGARALRWEARKRFSALHPLGRVGQGG